MKDTGITRKIDGLGRVVLPMELRRSLDIGEKAPIEIFVSNGDIVLRPRRLKCMCCGEENAGTIKQIGSIALCGKCVHQFGGDAK